LYFEIIITIISCQNSKSRSWKIQRAIFNQTSHTVRTNQSTTLEPTMSEISPLEIPYPNSIYFIIISYRNLDWPNNFPIHRRNLFKTAIHLL
jgi:hypothetical protein